MNELQISLIGIGVVVVGAIYVYNLWQEKRHRKVAEAMFSDPREDVLIPKTVPDAVGADHQNEERADPDVGFVRREPMIQAELDTELRREPSLSEPASQVATFDPPETVPDEPFPPISSSAESAEKPDLDVPDVPEVAPLNEVAEPSKAATGSGATPTTPSPSSLPAVPTNLYCPDSDAAAKLELVSPLKAAELLLMGLEAFSRVGKPVFWLGLEASSGQWIALSAETPGQFNHVQVVLQLADRQGPINLPELNLFLSAVQDIAVQLNAVLDTDDFESAKDRARDIDQFCADVDLQIGINVVGLSPFLGTKIRALAEAAGMTINWQGAFEKVDDNGRSLFVMSNLETTPFAHESLKTLRTHGLTFVLDVPRTAEGGFTFDHMLRLVRQFADVLQAKIVDDNKRPLSDEQLTNIRTQFVVGTQQKMAAQGIVAGSPLALRLFS